MTRASRLFSRTATIGLFFGALNTSSAQDTLRARVIWVENGRLYLNAGAEKGVSVGWQFRIQGWDTAHAGMYEGVLDRVYPDLSSAIAGPLSGLAPSALLKLPDAVVLASGSGSPHLAHVRVGFVNGGKPFRLPEDIGDYPVPASLFYPWTRSGALGDMGVLSAALESPAFDGRRWKLAFDTACRSGGEYPGGWGALADRLQGTIRERDSSDCPTVWALRPAAGGILGKTGVYFEGFVQVDDTALGMNFATPFFTLPEYVNSGDWRRAVAAAARFEPELSVIPPLWMKAGEHAWVRRAAPCQRQRQPFVIDTITVVPFENFEHQRLALELGEIDLAVMSVEDRLREKNSNVRFVACEQNALVSFGVNQEKKDLADNRLTTAISYLVDKPSLVRALLGGQAIVAHTIFGEEHLPGGVPFYPFDPRKGRQLLKELGLGRMLNFYVDQRIDRGMAVAEHIAAKLAEGKIRTRLVPADQRMFADPAYRVSMDIVLFSWPVDPRAPDATLYPFLYRPCARCGTNPLLFDDPRILELLEQARQEKEPALRERRYREVEYDLLAQPFICPLYRPIMTIAARSSVPGLRLTACGEIDIMSSGDSTRTEKAVR